MVTDKEDPWWPPPEVKVEMIVVTDILSQGDSLLFDPQVRGWLYQICVQDSRYKPIAFLYVRIIH